MFQYYSIQDDHLMYIIAMSLCVPGEHTKSLVRLGATRIALDLLARGKNTYYLVSFSEKHDQII